MQRRASCFFWGMDMEILSSLAAAAGGGVTAGTWEIRFGNGRKKRQMRRFHNFRKQDADMR
jgi:hypothetical protein